MNLIISLVFGIQIIFLWIFKPLIELVTYFLDIKFIPLILLFSFAFLMTNSSYNK